MRLKPPFDIFGTVDVNSIGNFVHNHHNAFVVVVTKSYAHHLGPLLASIRLSAPRWGVVVCCVDFDPAQLSALGHCNLCAVSLQFSSQGISGAQLGAFAANSRAALAFTLYNRFPFQCLVCLDVDSLVLRDPLPFLTRQGDGAAWVGFRFDETNKFSSAMGFNPFKAGVIVIWAGAHDGTVDTKPLSPILEEYAIYVSDAWDEWFADQWGLVYITLPKRNWPLIRILPTEICDWAFGLRSAIWSAKGSYKDCDEWLTFGKLIESIALYARLSIWARGAKYVVIVSAWLTVRKFSERAVSRALGKCRFVVPPPLLRDNISAPWRTVQFSLIFLFRDVAPLRVSPKAVSASFSSNAGIGFFAERPC